MTIFSRQKQLYEYDPKELDLNTLTELQTSLIAKLFLVNQELIWRFRNVTELGTGLPKSKGALAVLSDSADHLVKVNTFLKAELARITGKES